MTKRRISYVSCLTVALTIALQAAGNAAPTDLSSVPVTITAAPGAQQTFAGMGASLFRWAPSADFNRQLTRAQQRTLTALLWHVARFRSVRLWVEPEGLLPTPDAHNTAPYVDGWIKTHKLPDAIAAGAKDLILGPDAIPAAMGDGHGLIKDSAIPDYAGLLAGFIRTFRDETGILINHAAVLNEPNDRPVKLSDAQWPVMIRAFRHALDVRGLQTVKIVAPESANCGADAYAVVDAIKADPAAWAALSGIATHSYNNAATEDMARRADGKDYWITEAGGMSDTDENAGDALQAASIASRFLNDVNHRVTHWQFFIGAEQADPRGNTGRILKYDVAPFRLTVLQKYYYLKHLSATFDVGAVMRHSVSSLDGEMTYTYGRKPRLNAAVAKNPDGTWGIGVCNFTSDDFASPASPTWYHEQGGASAQTYAVTVRVRELAGVKTLRFAVRRSNAGVNDLSAGTVTMHYGQVTIPRIGPLDLMTLRSELAMSAGRKRSKP